MNYKKNFASYLVFFSALLLGGCASIQHSQFENTKHNRLSKFSSNAELNVYLQKIEQMHIFKEELHDALHKNGEDEHKITITGSRVMASQVGITNNQVSGVDEGDIVKLKDNLLIILRRGKIRVVDIGLQAGSSLKLISEVNAYPPNWKGDTWYDELLVHGNTILVTGYNYDLNGTELIRFNLEDDGSIKFYDAYLVSSGDYFDSENYASRLIGSQYITYVPTPLYNTSLNKNEPRVGKLPQIAKFPIDRKESFKWKPLFTAEDVYKPIHYVIEPTAHAMISCPIDGDISNCEAKAVISSSHTEFFVANDAMYLWAKHWSLETLLEPHFEPDWYDLPYYYPVKNRPVVENDQGTLFRIPFSDEDITSAKLSIEPLNQFSFHVWGDSLYVLGRTGVTVDDKANVALHKVPNTYFTQFGNNESEELLELGSFPDPVNNRFYKNHLITGSQTWWERNRLTQIDELKFTGLKIVEINGNYSLDLETNHATDRIEPFKNKFLVSGVNSNNNLVVSIVDTNNSLAVIAQKEFVGLIESEGRSHAFNSSLFDSNWLFGLTNLDKSNASSSEGRHTYFDDNVPADLLFLKYDNFDEIEIAGKMISQNRNHPKENDCKTSCYDWYGNTRPFFIRDRVFGLSGDELVEAKFNGEYLEEIFRLSM